ncbi:GNAT family N-acetyltransferase [Nocardiopsis sp. CNT-189]|uniref:GNAT family N-acetyltransferase n=1 Tax=Nocardiopsis oceanisediminis TaxID=2816862 RepID=UPI003B394200
MPDKAPRERTVLTGPDGAPLLDYLDRSAGDARVAASLRPLGPGAARAAAERLAGWRVVAPEEFARELVGLGGRATRRAHEMRRPLASDPPPASWPDLAPEAGGLRITPLDRTPEEVFRALDAAFPPGHPDRPADRDDPVEKFRALLMLLGGAVLGPVMGLSALVVDEERPEGDRVAAGLILNDRSDDVPWIGEVFRRPEPRYAGLGGLLLRRALARASAAGLAEVGLAVTADNPAKRLYDRLGFRDQGVFTTVLLPERPD